METSTYSFNFSSQFLLEIERTWFDHVISSVALCSIIQKIMQEDFQSGSPGSFHQLATLEDQCWTSYFLK